MIVAAIGFGSPAVATPLVGPSFDWNPVPLGLHGGKFSADTIRLSDFGQVVVDPASGQFTDVGVMPILGFSLAGKDVAPAGYGAADGWGAYVAYQGTGTQQYMADGSVVATYATLSYSILGYNGLAAFGLGPTGVPYAAGGTDLTLLGKGELIAGSLAMRPVGLVDGVPVVEVQGEVAATIGGVPRAFSSNTFLGFDLALVHRPGEFFPVSPTVFLANGGSSSTATLLAGKGNSAAAHAGPAARGLVAGASAAEAATVPEPGSWMMVAVGLGVLGVVARGRVRAAAS